MALMTRIEALKFLDACVGRTLISVHSPPYYDSSHTRRNAVLLIRPGGIGDAVLLIPAITALKRKYPEAVIDLLSEKRNAAVFSLCPDINTVYHYDRPRELLSVLRRTYDVVIDTEQWHRMSAVVSRMTRTPMSIGFSTNERRKMFSHPVPYEQDQYEVDSFFNLIRVLRCGSEGATEKPFLSVPERYQQKVSEQLSDIVKKEFIAIFPGSSILERRWGNERFHEAAIRLASLGYRIVVVGGGNDVRAGEEVIHDVPNAITLCGRLSLPETAAVLQQTSLLITGDSGIMHIACGLGVKLVALFGPGREKKWAPRGQNCIVINKNLPCSPCTTFGYTRRCRKDAECMRAITVEEVIKASFDLLKR